MFSQRDTSHETPATGGGATDTRPQKRKMQREQVLTSRTCTDPGVGRVSELFLISGAGGFCLKSRSASPNTRVLLEEGCAVRHLGFGIMSYQLPFWSFDESGASGGISSEPLVDTRNCRYGTPR